MRQRIVVVIEYDDLFWHDRDRDHTLEELRKDAEVHRARVEVAAVASDTTTREVQE